MTRPKRLWHLLALVLVSAALLRAQTENVPVANQVYEFLDRMGVKGILPLYANTVMLRQTWLIVRLIYCRYLVLCLRFQHALHQSQLHHHRQSQHRRLRRLAARNGHGGLARGDSRRGWFGSGLRIFWLRRRCGWTTWWAWRCRRRNRYCRSTDIFDGSQARHTSAGA